MDFQNYQNRRVAVICLCSYEDIPSGLGSWHITDIDLFFENLDMWSSKDRDDIDQFFSQPIPGIKQHLANRRNPNVVIIGSRLAQDNSLVDKIKIKYLESGYDVIIFSNNNTQFLHCPNDGKVRLAFK